MKKKRKPKEPKTGRSERGEYVECETVEVVSEPRRNGPYSKLAKEIIGG